MLLEGLSSGFLKLVSVEACGVQLPEQSGRLLAESCLDLRELVEVFAPEDLVESVGFGLDAAYAAGPPEQGLQPLARQFRGLCRGRGRSQDRAGLP